MSVKYGFIRLCCHTGQANVNVISSISLWCVAGKERVNDRNIININELNR